MKKRRRRSRRLIVRRARVEFIKREETCVSCERLVLATVDSGLCGRCAVWHEYTKRAELGVLTAADRASRPGRIIFAR